MNFEQNLDERVCMNDFRNVGTNFPNTKGLCIIQHTVFVLLAGCDKTIERAVEHAALQRRLATEHEEALLKYGFPGRAPA